VSVSGLLAPGSSIQKLTVDGDLTFVTSSTFAYEMDSGADKSLAGDLQIVKGGGSGLNSLSIGTNVELTLQKSELGTGTFASDTTLSLVQYEGKWNGGFFTYGTNKLSNGETFTDTYGNQWTIRYDASAGGDNFVMTGSPMK